MGRDAFATIAPRGLDDAAGRVLREECLGQRQLGQGKFTMLWYWDACIADQLVHERLAARHSENHRIIEFQLIIQDPGSLVADAQFP
jgi:hypothetical protein